MTTQPENEQLPQEAAPATPTSGIGQRLREAREARGLQTSDVAQALKITQRQIEAMEQERFEQLPGAAFVRGFLRNYARYVGLSLEDEIRALVLQNEDTVPARAVYRVPEKGANEIDWLATATPLHSGARKKGGGLGRLLKIILLLVLIAVPVAAYFDWFRIHHVLGVSGTSQDADGGLFEGQQTEILLPGLQGEASAPEDGQEDGEAPSGLAPAPTAISLPTPQAEVLGANGVPASSGSNTATEGNEAAPAADASQEGAAAEGNEPPLVSLDTAAAAPAGNSKLVFEAGTESWVTVQDSSGRQLLNKRLPRGVPTSVEGKPPFRLTVGNAAKVKMTRDGEPVDLAPHTRSGGVARLTLE